MSMASARERLHWLAMHGVVRSVVNVSARRGDPQSRFIADPTVRSDPVGFFEELREQGPLVRARVSFLTVDHAVAHELLRSDDFRVISMGSTLPKPLSWLERRTRADLLHPLLPPSLLRGEDTGDQGFGVRSDEGSVWILAPKAAASLVRVGDLLLAALVEKGAGHALTGPVVALPPDAESLIG